MSFHPTMIVMMQEWHDAISDLIQHQHNMEMLLERIGERAVILSCLCIQQAPQECPARPHQAEDDHQEQESQR
jgi:hypothetical protein